MTIAAPERQFDDGVSGDYPRVCMIRQGLSQVSMALPL